MFQRLLIRNPKLFLHKSGVCNFSVASRKHFERRLLKYSCQQVYDIVANVNSYYQFVPWCKESKVISNDRNNPNKLKAELVVGFGMFNERYTSDIIMVDKESIKATSIEASVLEYLISEWKFSPASDPKSCWVTFQINFKFKSEIYNHVSDMFLTEVVSNMVIAFEERCKKVYNNK